MALGRAGALEEAEQQLRDLAAVHRDDTRALRELHAILKEQAREEDALDAIEAAVARDPADVELLLAMASQRLLLLRTEAAEQAYRQVLEREPLNPLANLGLAVVSN